MIKFNLNDRELFGNEAGEDESLEVLNSYFVDHPDFESFYSKDEALSIVSARKGMGKSALLSRLQYKLQNESQYSNPIVVRTKGNDLLGLGDFTGKDHAFLENYWKQIICKEIIMEIGKGINVALSSDEMSIIEISELDGLKSKNIIGGLVSRVCGKIPGLSADIKSSIPENLEALLSNYVDKNGNSAVWILIDDIDSKFINNDEYHARVGSFFSAIRALSHDLQNLRVRSTVRSDVWSCLRELEDLDKVDQYIIEIFWAKKYMRDILSNKILAYIKRNYPSAKEAKYSISRDYNNLLDLLFLSPIEWRSSKQTRLFEAIAAFSNRRPRWMAQLCRMASSKAKEIPSTKKISLNHINFILKDFGKKRRDDLLKEHKHQFKDLSLVVDAFRATKKEFVYEEINQVIEDNYIRGRDALEIPDVDGSKYISSEDLGNFMYKLGLISRVHDDLITFTHFFNDPDLFRSIENRKGNIKWSIHPTYRSFLNIR